MIVRDQSLKYLKFISFSLPHFFQIFSFLLTSLQLGSLIHIHVKGATSHSDSWNYTLYFHFQIYILCFFIKWLNMLLFVIYLQLIINVRLLLNDCQVILCKQQFQFFLFVSPLKQFFCSVIEYQVFNKMRLFSCFHKTSKMTHKYAIDFHKIISLFAVFTTFLVSLHRFLITNRATAI